MDADELDQLFTKFFRGKSHPGDDTKGSGLGLYLSKYFIELHHGSVDVESKKGAGSRFRILLPINAIS
jgi:signal transduction histidine kinase